MKISSAFPSKFLKAEDLQKREVKVVIDRIILEDLGDEEKPIAYFQGKQKGLVLNKTNASKIAAALGDDTDEWEGKEIILYPDVASYQGRMVDCIRVRVPAAPAEDGGEAPF
jgi:hypothetical protein